MTSKEILALINEVVIKKYGKENNLWTSEEEALENDGYPGLISGAYYECLIALEQYLESEAKQNAT